MKKRTAKRIHGVHGRMAIGQGARVREALTVTREIQTFHCPFVLVAQVCMRYHEVCGDCILTFTWDICPLRVSSPSPPPPPPPSSCPVSYGCCEDRSVTVCLSCSFYESCCKAISGCTWTSGYSSGGTCSGRPTSNAKQCCGGVCHYDDPATDTSSTLARTTYQKTLLNLQFGFWHECSTRYYYKFKGKSVQGYVWGESGMETLEYENWVQQTCKFNFDVTIRSASGSESVNLPQIEVLGKSISVAGVSLTLGVSVQMSLGLSASLLFTGTDAVNAKAEAQQMVKIGCKNRCQTYSGSPDIIFERSFVSSNSDNFKAVTGISGALEPSVSLSLSAGIMGNFGSMGDWGFKIYGVVKLSLPITIRTGYYLSAISNPNRFFIGGSIAACSQKHSLDFQAIMKVDLLFVDVTIAVYWKTVTRLIQPQNLVTFDLILFCHGEECAPGKSPGSGDICVSCSAGTYKTSTGSAACTFCPSGKYSAAVGQTSETTCSACQANSNSPAGSDAATDCACNAGFTGTNGGTCAICVAGKYKGGTGNLACLDCGVGKYSTATGQTAESTCIYCPTGKYSGAVAQTAESSCLVCPSNSHAPVGSGSASNCVCNAGFAGSTGGTCGVCAAGKYKAGTGNVACSDCEAGKNKAKQGVNTACDNCGVRQLRNLLARRVP